MAKSATKKRKLRKSDKRQSERFLEAARKLEVDEKKGEFFEEIFKKIVPPKRAGK
jgi:hypothetical protein